MSNSFFFLQAEQNHANSAFIKALEGYANENGVQIYVIDKPLGDSKYSYGYKGGLVVLAPKHKLMILDFEGSKNEFDEYSLDLIEDLGSISDKYQYKSVVGRTRKWSAEVIYIQNKPLVGQSVNVVELMSENYLPDPVLQKKAELLISLLTGSINDIERVKDNIPDSILDKIKQKILLFDGDQTRFVYQEKNQKVITIQGLSGTGKTELLLHKLKDLYVNREESRILFTCHNKILAASLRSRIPDFFNFMKVEQQIKWNERLWCTHAWGSQIDLNSGAYRYICGKYDLTFHRYSYSMPFSRACELAIEQLKSIDISEIGYAFDYILLDESQDFPKEFVELCGMVTATSVYVAGDIFQSIFDENIVSEVKPDFLLSKCYRTDPRTLMFAHGVGMGLFEEKKLRWLNDDQWLACGYIVEKELDDKIYHLKREPLRRFEDLQDNDVSSVEIVRINQGVADSSDIVISVMESIKRDNPTVTANDIGVVFTGGNKAGFELADVLEYQLPLKFGWHVNKAWESKSPIPNTLLVSNKNNVKGLEFPFVICITDYISDREHERNALYMLLTRSFIQSYILIPERVHPDKLKLLEKGLAGINNNGYLTAVTPDKDQLERIRTTIEFDSSKLSLYEIAEAVFDEQDVPPLWRDPVFGLVKAMDAEPTYENISNLVAASVEGMAIQSE